MRGRIYQVIVLFEFMIICNASTGKQHSGARDVVDSNNCFFDGQKTCYDCRTVALCIDSADGFQAYAEPCTVEGEVCNIAQEATASECTSSPTSTEPGAACICNPSLTQPRTEEDPYTDFSYLQCENDTTYYIPCANDYEYNADTDGCAPLPPTCQYIGIFPFPDDCDFYYICNHAGSPGIVVKCPGDTFFNPNTDSCEDPLEKAASCLDFNGNSITGLIPSPIYCSYYYICDNGRFVSMEKCPTGEIFDSANNVCITDDGSCISIGYCF